MTKGYKQEYEIDYIEVCAPFVRHDIIKVGIVLAI